MVFAVTEDKLYREGRNTCPVQLGHCLGMLGIVLSLVFFFFFPSPLTDQLSVAVCGSDWPWGHAVTLVGTQSWRMAEGEDSSTAVGLTPRRREVGLREPWCFPAGGAGVRERGGSTVHSTPREMGKTGKETLNC